MSYEFACTVSENEHILKWFVKWRHWPFSFLLKEHMCWISTQKRKRVFIASSAAFIKIVMILGLHLHFFWIFKTCPFFTLLFSFSKTKTKNSFKKFYTFPQSPSLLTFRPQSKTFLLSQAFPIGKRSSFFFLWGILTAGLNLIIVFCTYFQKPQGMSFTFFQNFQMNIFRNAHFWW